MQGHLRRSAADALDMMLDCKRDFSLAQPLHEIVETEISRDRAAMSRCCGSGDISGLPVVHPGGYPVRHGRPRTGTEVGGLKQRRGC